MTVETQVTDPRTPIDLVTGFLGSGKTTLIAELLRHPAMGETVVIVNEVGEVGIDHHLLRRVDERTVLLDSGCLCCSLRSDLTSELSDLNDRRARGEIPHFRRVVVETTGLAEPAPIVHTLLTDNLVRRDYLLERVISTVDAVHGLSTEASVRQVIAADRIVVTKSDLADPAALLRELDQLNPQAEMLVTSFGAVEPDRLFGGAERALRLTTEEPDGHRHDGMGSVCLVFDETLNWTAFALWLTMLLAARGDQFLRVKGMLNTGAEGPVVVNTVQHVVHPIIHLTAWPDADRRSRLVLIGRDLDRAMIERSLRAFTRLGATSAA